MGCLVKIVFALTVLMIVYGAYELSIWFRERAPVEMTVRQYASSADPPKWVVLKDGWVDWREAREAMDDWYVPVRPLGSTGQTNIVLEIRDPAHLKLARERSAGDATVYTGPLRALGGGELFASRRRERAIRGGGGGGVASRFVILRENTTPSFWLPLLSLVGGCLLVRAGF